MPLMWVVNTSETRGQSMQTRLQPFKIGDIEVQVEAVVTPRSHEVSTKHGGDAVTEGSTAAFERVEQVIEAVSERTAAMIAEQVKSNLAPDETTVAFGVSFSVEGGLVFAKGTAGSTIEVTLTYKNHAKPATAA